MLAPAAALDVWVRDVRARRARRLVRLRPEIDPSGLTTFQARAGELDWLRKRHNEMSRRNSRQRRRARVVRILPRRAGESGQSAGRPLMLFIYGRPGVGKTALAQVLAQMLRRSYPDGQLSADLGVAGGRRSPRDILRVFLGQLGMPEDELREAVLLGNAFRAATDKRRLVIILDAARDARQIQAVLPGGDRCAVIVTSRANLAWTEHNALRVDTPSPAEAARILRAYLETDADLPGPIEMPSAESIAQAAELCGRQPIALRAVGDKARHARGGLREVVEGLLEPRTRLRRLAYGGRDAAERISTEYDLLGRKLQQALQVLTVVYASSFTPWVFQPLLGTSLVESANLMASLSEVGLLDEFQADPTGFPRYQFNTLVRLFAERELGTTEALGETRAVRTRRNLRRALLILALQVNQVLDPETDFGIPPGFPHDWIPGIANWRSRVAAHADFWVRVEYPNLVEAVREAYGCGLFTLTWKLAAQLTDCDVTHPFTDAVRDAFDKAREAAGSADDPGALAWVLLAEGSAMVAGEDYAEAVATLAKAFHAAEELGDRLVSARACRLIGQVEQRCGTFGAAANSLRTAQEALRQATPLSPASELGKELTRERAIVASLLAENELITSPARDPGTVSRHSRLLPANASFAEHLTAARIARRCDDLTTAREELDKAADAIGGDDRLAFQLRLERLSCSLATGLAPADRADAVADAAHLVVASAAESAAVSSAEARILLAQALLANGDAAQCLSTLSELPPGAVPADRFPRVYARLLRLQAEARYVSRDLAGAEQSAREATKQFGAMNDFMSRAEAQLLLGAIQLRSGQRAAARISLLTALETFQRCGDVRNADQALALLAGSAFVLAARVAVARIRCWLLRTDRLRLARVLGGAGGMSLPWTPRASRSAGSRRRRASRGRCAQGPA
jgi:tetratricopeptide (TPR) repeat protein